MAEKLTLAAIGFAGAGLLFSLAGLASVMAAGSSDSAVQLFGALAILALLLTLVLLTVLQEVAE